MHTYDVIRRPVVTEKNSQMQALNKYVFEVAGEANKTQVKQAVETAFKVGVTGVNIIKVPGKMRRIGRRQAMTQAWKKAIVTLKAGDRIELFEGV